MAEMTQCQEWTVQMETLFPCRNPDKIKIIVSSIMLIPFGPCANSQTQNFDHQT